MSGSVGEGEFTVEGDRQKLAPVMRSIVKNKLLLSLQAGELPTYRRHLNLQTVHFRGLEIAPVGSFIHGDEASCVSSEASDPATTFLYQNGLINVRDKDSAGFWPLHYAALSGNWQAVEGLLASRADPNRRTGNSRSALDLAMFHRHNDAAKLLISARARLEGGFHTSIWAVQWHAILLFWLLGSYSVTIKPQKHVLCSHCLLNSLGMQMAAISNAEGLHLLRAAGGDPLARNWFGASPLDIAAGY